MGAYLYKNHNGKPVTVHSYSGGSDFSFCKRKYFLSRIEGWKDKGKFASTEFGKAIEDAIQFFHQNGEVGGSGLATFQRKWAKHKNNTELSYTDKEGSWEEQNQVGIELMSLYELVYPTFGYSNPKFQLNYKKEVFPGTSLAGIEFTAYVDMKCEYRKKPLLIDIKASGASLPDKQNLITLDPQLRSYAWVSGIPDVGFLWFQKTKPSAPEKGDTVTLLTSFGDRFKAGDRVVCVSKVDDGYGFVTPNVYESWSKSALTLRGNELKDSKLGIIRNWGFVAKEGLFTKQKIVFVTATIPEEDIKETGDSIGMDIAQIVRADRAGKFPKEPGIRFPNQKCQYCSMLGICTNNKQLRDEKLVKLGAPIVEEEPDAIEEFFGD